MTSPVLIKASFLRFQACTNEELNAYESSSHWFYRLYLKLFLVAFAILSCGRLVLDFVTSSSASVWVSSLKSVASNPNEMPGVTLMWEAFHLSALTSITLAFFIFLALRSAVKHGLCKSLHPFNGDQTMIEELCQSEMAYEWVEEALRSRTHLRRFDLLAMLRLWADDTKAPWFKVQQIRVLIWWG